MKSTLESRCYTMADVMAMLGLSKCTVYNMARDGQIPCVKIGRKYLVSKIAFDRWLETLSID